MNKKQGTARQRCATAFDKTPATGTSLCPFKGPDIAIVPMRYALDRSRYDPNPHALTPLSKAGKWPALPELKSRTYTLRQLYDGYVYVFDETAGTLHEYAFSATDAGLQRIVWTEAHLGQDERTGAGEALPYLLYPRNHSLHIAYAPMQWTWRICEHLRSHEDSRAMWMKRVDLASYCITMNEPGTLPLSEIARAVADVDAGCINEDQRFADTALPSTQPQLDPEKPDKKPEWVPLGADVHWLGSVPDKDSALLIALDDSLAILKDLGMQLAGDQAAYQSWQAEHEHKLEIASLVSNLCGTASKPEKDKLPGSVRNSPVMTQQYLIEAEEYLEQYELEERLHTENTTVAPEIFFMSRTESDAKLQALKDRYGHAPDQADVQSWLERSKWRREVDLQAARIHMQQQHLPQQRLLQKVRDTQADFETWAERIGIDPLELFIDTGNIRTLDYLKMIMENLLTIWAQDMRTTDWLMEQENRATTLFGTMRYGFSPALKEALHNEADKLINGVSDFTNLATRAGELNALLNHKDFANAPWMKALKQPVQDTFKALRTLASDIGKETAQRMLIAWLPVDSRLAQGKQLNVVALLRTLLIGQILSNSPERLVVDTAIASKLKEWQRQRRVLLQHLDRVQMRWFYPSEPWVRRGLTAEVQACTDRLKAHDLKLPMLVDFQNNQYAKLFQQEIEKFFQSGKNVVKHWQQHVRNWSQRLGIHGASISWGVIILNFINTALTLEEVSRDGDLSKKDLVKVGYNLGYSFNLLMALYVEAPWAIVKNAQPMQSGNYQIGILERSSRYWKAQGNSTWASAVRSFRSRLLAAGAWGVAAAALEFSELNEVLENAKNPTEKNILRLKAIGIFFMGAAALGQGISAIITGSLAMSAATIVLGGWFAIITLTGGLIYLLASTLLNYLKQDNIGSWLKKCCWSYPSDSRYPDTPDGHAQELKTLLEIQLSPQIMVKSTTEQEWIFTGKNHVPIDNQNGAWVQIRFPHVLRGRGIFFDIISSKRPLGVMPVRKIESSIKDTFLEEGTYASIRDWGNINNQRQPYGFYPALALGIPEEEDIIWKAWVPLDKEATFLEFQIWYPVDILHPSTHDTGYLYQIELSAKGVSTIDALGNTELQVKNKSREAASQIFLMQ
ncbi:hypothetical protein PS3A_53070 [Pseudomonas sp. 3A(2025)]